ncbi:MAG: DUF6531 domain-containing protein, partial [Planctomycetota bacterium]
LHDALTDGVQVYLSNGEFYRAVTDLSIPGRGFPFQFTRQYRSQLDYDGPLGYGWDFNYNARLKKAGNDILYFDGSGRLHKYSWNGTGFITPPGLYNKLEYNAPNNKYTITQRNGTVFTFTQNPLETVIYNLQSIRDRHILNQMYFTYGDNPNKPGQQYILLSINDTLSRNISFVWDANNRLDYFQDWSGRKIDFEYDVNGDLSSVTSPAAPLDYPNGKITRYDYYSGNTDARLNHNLRSITDPKNQVYLTNVYDANDRIQQQTYGTGTFQFSCVTNLEKRITQATVTDRNQNIREYFLDSPGNVSKMIQYTRGVRPSDPGSYATLYEHNANMERTKTIFPRGNSIEYIFDDQEPDPRAQGNLRQVIRRTAQGAELITRFSYESRFNQIQTIIDAAGRTTQFFFDYQEPSLGDLNNDNYTGGDSGDIVKVVYPTVTSGLSAQNGAQIIEAKFWYNQYGQITRSINPENYITTYSYYATGTSNGYLETITRDFGSGVDPKTIRPYANIINRFEYNSVGNVTRSFDGKDNPTAFTVNELNQITETISRGPGYRVRFQYDANDNIERIETENRDAIPDPANPGLMPAWLTTTYGYDILDNLTLKKEQGTSSKYIQTGYSYDPNENPRTTTQPAGNKVQQTYDERNLLFETYRGYGTVDWTRTQRFYNLNGNLEKIMDGNGNATTYLFDGFDRAIGYVDALGNKVEQELDALGNVTRVVRKNSASVILSEAKYLYDELNRNYETHEWLDTTNSWVITRNEFDKNSRIIRTIDANGHESKTFYDGLDRVTKTQDHLGNTVEYTYDANSNVIEVKETELTQDAQPTTQIFVTSNEYDHLDRLIKTTNPIGVSRERNYDSRHNLVRTIDGEQNTISHYYDGLNRLYKTMRDLRQGGTATQGDWLPNQPGAIIEQVVTQNVWDDNSRLINIIDANNNITIRAYDVLNRLKEETYADGSSRKYSYDEADNGTKIIDRNGSVIDQTFDTLNRLTRKDITRGNGVIGVTYETFGYDALSRMTSGANDYSQVTQTYDSLSRLIQETQQIGAQPVKSVVSDYDHMNNRT